MTTTPAQDLTAALEKIPEVDQHERIYRPLLANSPLDERQFLKRLLAEARHTPPRMQQLINDLMQESVDEVGDEF